MLHHSGCSLRVTLAVKSRSPWSQSLLPLTPIALPVPSQIRYARTGWNCCVKGTFAFCPAPSSGMNQDSRFHSCCACLVSAALTTANQSSPLLPAASLVPGLCQGAQSAPASVPAGPWLSLELCSSWAGMSIPLTAVHTDVFAADATGSHCCSDSLAWLYFPHCPGFWLVGVFSSQGCLYKWVCYYYQSAVFKRYYPQTQTAPMPPP